MIEKFQGIEKTLTDGNNSMPSISEYFSISPFSYRLAKSNTQYIELFLRHLYRHEFCR
jgi:hypothetical protein